MNRKRKQYLIWTTIAGVLFMIVGVHDLFFSITIDKSGVVIVGEIVAGLCSLLNALLKWRKWRTKDSAGTVC